MNIVSRLPTTDPVPSLWEHLKALYCIAAVAPLDDEYRQVKMLVGLSWSVFVPLFPAVKSAFLSQGFESVLQQPRVNLAVQYTNTICHTQTLWSVQQYCRNPSAGKLLAEPGDRTSDTQPRR